MSRLCVIGNSHIGTLRLGWHALSGSERRSWSVDFFAALDGLQTTLEARSGRLVSDSTELRLQFLRSAAMTRIRPERYQAFAIVGFDVSPTTLAKRANGYRTWKYAEAERPVVSQRCFEAAMEDVLAAGTARGLAAKLRSLSPAPIIFVPAPQPSTEMEGSTDEPLRWLTDRGMAQALFAAMKRGLACLEQNTGFSWLTQPRETLVDDQPYTKPEYARNAVDGYGKELRADLLHMNAEFGVIASRALIAACETRLSAAQDKPVPAGVAEGVGSEA